MLNRYVLRQDVPRRCKMCIHLYVSNGIYTCQNREVNNLIITKKLNNGCKLYLYSKTKRWKPS